MKKIFLCLIFCSLLFLYGCSSSLLDEEKFPETLILVTATGPYSSNIPIYQEPDDSSPVIAQLSGTTSLTCNLVSTRQTKENFIKVELLNTNSFGWVKLNQCKFDSLALNFYETNQDRIEVCRYALRFLGAVYSDENSENRNRGLSCNQLLNKCYQHIGYNSYEKLSVKEYNKDEYGKEISGEELRPGDIVFYNGIYGGQYSHVGMYLGSGFVIQSTVDQGDTYPQGGVHITRIVFRSSPTKYRNPFND